MQNPSNPVHLRLPKSQQTTRRDDIYMNHWHVFPTVCRHASNCILLNLALHLPGTPPIGSSATMCYFVALFSRWLIKLPTLFTLIYSSLNSQLHFINHWTYGLPGEKSLLAEESRSSPWESTCTCTHEYSQSSLPIKCLNFQPSFQVNYYRSS
jgi:hypothetical protein